MTLDEIYAFGVNELTRAGIKDAKIDASIFLEEICNIKKGYLLAHGNEELNETCGSSLEQRYIEAIKKRSERIPLQHILGYTSFMGLRFKVNENVLIPRQDTEILVEEALKEVHDGMEILDMCTGSGCILISLLKYTNGCIGVGADISEKALEIARENSDAILGEAMDITYSYVNSDLFENIDGKFDVIVSNPPYIATNKIDSLEPEVKDYDPIGALDGGEDGLYFYQKIITEAPKYLKLGGSILFEIGYDEKDAVSKLLEENGFTDIEVIKDYAGLDRVVKARRKICLTN
ncbi:MAG: peptide chain release factor N(5)-glutamine methyltransferase [Lachnospiraceae bacterium]|nr:peptide chain release factor N(5)-glutamine methyltransferase [Lachnospiraceae bacterium]